MKNKNVASFLSFTLSDISNEILEKTPYSIINGIIDSFEPIDYQHTGSLFIESTLMNLTPMESAFYNFIWITPQDSEQL